MHVWSGIDFGWQASERRGGWIRLSWIHCPSSSALSFQVFLFIHGKSSYYCIYLNLSHWVDQTNHNSLRTFLSSFRLSYECLFDLWPCSPKSVFIMGGGEGSTAREALRHRSVERVIMCDIDEASLHLRSFVYLYIHLFFPCPCSLLVDGTSHLRGSLSFWSKGVR